MATTIRSVLVLIAVLTFTGELEAQDMDKQTAAALGVQQIIAHRGSSADRPENTLASIWRAIDARATAVEVDVRLSRDNQLVLRHDETLDATTSGQGLVRDKTLAELQALDAGSWFDAKFAGERIPTLEAALAVCKGRIDVLLDLKESGDDYARLVVECVEKHGDPARTLVGVRSVEQAQQFHTLLPKARQLGLIARPEEIGAYAAAGVETIRLWPRWLTDQALVGRVRKAGAGLHLNGTTGAKEEVLALLQHRPNSLSSDDPARLLQALASLASENHAAALAPLQGEIRLPGLKDFVYEFWTSECAPAAAVFPGLSRLAVL